MIHRAETIILLVAVAVSAVVLGSAIALLVVRAILHLSRWVGRRRDGRGGDVLEALARRIEG